MRIARLLLLLGLVLAVAPSTALALTKAEKKAVDIKSVKGASTATAAFVDIRFKQDLEDLLGTRGLRNATLKVKFVPAAGGKATKITETGPSDDAETLRRGTKGPADVVRAGRTFTVVVSKLPAVAGKVVVTTSRPAGKLDKLRKKLPPLTTETTLELEAERTDAQITSLRDAQQTPTTSSTTRRTSSRAGISTASSGSASRRSSSGSASSARRSRPGSTPLTSG